MRPHQAEIGIVMHQPSHRITIGFKPGIKAGAFLRMGGFIPKRVKEVRVIPHKEPDIRHEAAVDFLRTPAVGLDLGALVEVVRNEDAVLGGLLHALECELP